jgi:uncharacterized coiled-coil protein SlyX
MLTQFMTATSSGEHTESQKEVSDLKTRFAGLEEKVAQQSDSIAQRVSQHMDDKLEEQAKDIKMMKETVGQLAQVLSVLQGRL